MKVLVYLPESDSYSYKPAEQYARVQHQGAAGRYSKTVPNPTVRVEATWLLDANELREFGEFYLEHGEGEKPFLIDLMVRDITPRQCVAFFDSDAFSFNSTSGESYRVSCSLQVAEL